MASRCAYDAFSDLATKIMPTDIITFWQSHKPATPDSAEQWPLNWIATDIKFFGVRKRREIIVHCFYLLKKYFGYRIMKRKNNNNNIKKEKKKKLTKCKGKQKDEIRETERTK